MDRGHTDLALFGRWYREGVFSVAQMKDGTAYSVEESRSLPQGHRILVDEIILPTGAPGEIKCPVRPRQSSSEMPTNSSRSKC